MVKGRRAVAADFDRVLFYWNRIDKKMFHGLFEDEEASNPRERASTGTVSTISKPVSPRGPTRLSGLSNLGATCYLNSLLQTLHYTPELRGKLIK